jgi:hypothetical protein
MLLGRIFARAVLFALPLVCAPVLAQSPAPLALPDLSTLTFTGATASQVHMIGADSAGGVYIGGSFTQVNGLPTAGAARLAADGTLDTTWTSGLPGGTATKAHVDGGGGVNLVVFDGSSVWTVWRRTASSGVLVHTATTGYGISAVSSDRAGNLYVAEFASAIEIWFGHTVSATVYKVSPSGGRIAGFQLDLNGQNPCETTAMAVGIIPRVLAMTHDGADMLYIAGDFTMASSTAPGAVITATSGGLVRVSTATGNLDTWFPVPATEPASAATSAGLKAAKLTCIATAAALVHDVAVPGDGFVYAAGSFDRRGAQALARFSDTTAAVDASWKPAFPASPGSVPIVSAIVLDRERHRIYAGDRNVNRFAAYWLFPGAARDATFDPQPDQGVDQLGIAGARVTAGGNFTAFGSAPRVNVAAFPLSGTSIIENYYQSILGRAPDSSGIAFWGNSAVSLAARGASPNEAYIAMAMFFFASQEFRATPLTDAEFVDRLYLTFFDRTADASGKQFWVQSIGETSRENVLFAFMFSPEFDSYMSTNLNGPYPMRPEIGVVMDFYRGALGRLPDSGGLSGWVNLFRQAQCSADPVGNAYQAALAISDAFFKSAEYAQRARANGEYVSDLYNAFMRRSADGNGFFFWENRLGGSFSRDDARRTFVDTPEFGARVQAIANAGCVAQMQ